MYPKRKRATVGPMFDDHKQKPSAETPAALPSRPLLELGLVVATPGALTALAEAHESAEWYLRRHQSGDWGDLCPEDRAVNRQALRLGQRVLSEYGLPTGEKLWIITDWDRSVTTLLLPVEY